MLEVLLMELEGVLVDTREARRAALLESLAEEGVVLDATEFDEVAVGMTPRQGARALLARHGRMRATSSERGAR